MGADALYSTHFLGVPVVSAEPDVVVNHVIQRANESPSPGYHVHLLAGHSVVMAHEDAEFAEVLRSDAVVIPDGRWLELLTKKDKHPLWQLRGHDLVQHVCDRGRRSGLRHYFFTSSDAVSDALLQRLAARYSGIELAGASSYPFGQLGTPQRSELVQQVSAARPDVVWMGISSPRQDKEALWLSAATHTTVICVGAALEFEAGIQRPAPRWVQRVGFEWLYRLLREPGRLLHRYTVGSWAFVRLVIRDRMARS